MEALEDASEVFDRALASKTGIAITFRSEKGARSFRHRLYSYRHALRVNSHTLYAPDDELFGVVPENHIRLSMELGPEGKGPFRLILRKMDPKTIEDMISVEEI